MTDTDTLRLWAEAAGLEWVDIDSYVTVLLNDRAIRQYPLTDPALIPLIAERLVERVPNTLRLVDALLQTEGFSPRECFRRPPTHALLKATAEQRAAAAYGVLRND